MSKPLDNLITEHVEHLRDTDPAGYARAQGFLAKILATLIEHDGPHDDVLQPLFAAMAEALDA